MAKTVKRVISLILAAVLVVSTFAGCGKSNKAEEPLITATAVKYSKSGKYTTTVSSEKIDLSGIDADSVEVWCTDPDIVLEQASVDSAEASGAKTESSKEEQTADLDKLYSFSAKVESVKASGDKGCEITFTDEKAAEYATGGYTVLFKNIEGENNTADVAVEFPEIKLTPDIDSVVSNAKETKVALAIDGSAFEEGISEKDIYLDNAFSDMKIESVSSSDKNLTVQLKGSPVRNEAGAYQWGSVNVKPSGIKDGYADVTSKINIQLASAYIDSETLKYENGVINAELKIYGVADIDSLTKDNIKINSATVESAEKTDENTVKLTVSADGVKSVNDFADVIGGEKMTLGKHETTVSVSQASFYPVFDYVEKDGDNFKITLKLYANCGTFDEKLDANAVSYADDFKDAKTESVKVDSDTVATLVLSVPASGQSTETMDLSGTVTLAAGALVNSWGDKNSKEVSNNRDYNGETLGREVTLNTDTLLEIQKYTRGKNTFIGKIFYWGGVAGKVYNIGKCVLEVTGVIKSEHQQIMEEFAAINTKLDGIHSDLISIRNDLAELKNNDYRIMLQNYQSEFDTFDKKLRDVLTVYSQAAEDIQEEYPEYKDITVEDLTDEELAVYNERIMKFISAREDDVSDDKYGDFAADFAELKLRYERVTSMLKRTSNDNPLRLYDESCALTYNFDSQCYEFRLAQREYAKAQLTKALAVFAVRYNANKNPDNKNFANMTTDYREAVNMIDELSDVGYSAKKIEAALNGEDTETYISDLLVAGKDTDDIEEVKKLLTDKGFTPIPTNLNEGAGGFIVLLGYKTTHKPSEAIKTLTTTTQPYSPNLFFNPIRRSNYKGIICMMCNCVGDEAFINDYGNLNCGSTTPPPPLVRNFIHFSKEGKTNEAITDIYFDDNAEDCVNLYNLNIGTTSEVVLHMHCRTASYDEDLSNCLPYSYVLGKRITLRDTKSISNYDGFGGAIKNGSGYRNWTENEYNDFVRRIHTGSLKEEFKSAGLDINNALLLTYSKENKSGYRNQYETWKYYRYSGDIIKTNATSKNNAQLGISYTYKYDGKTPKTKNMDVTYIELVN
ncbi:MAG: hypothetical protein E7571_01180 [Ruminococcaceae bacterium]|jgi:hypothetical protein|nr:hypothetical protein [Oscillospiraceae bacterium]